jgi:hypothetical protein
MKIKYECELCGFNYDEVDLAMNCEKSHKIIKPHWYWLIPPVGLVLWGIFLLKGDIVRFPKNEFGLSTFKDIIVLGPIILILSIFFLLII